MKFLCRFPFGSITVLCTVDGVATCGAWLTSVFNSMSCVSIVCLSASCAVVIAVIGFDKLSQTLSAMLSKSSSCNIAWYVSFELFFFFLSEHPISVVLGHFSPIVAFPLSFSLTSSLSFSISVSFSFPFPFSFSFSFLDFRPISLVDLWWLVLCLPVSFGNSRCAYRCLVVHTVANRYGVDLLWNALSCCMCRSPRE